MAAGRGHRWQPYRYLIGGCIMGKYGYHRWRRYGFTIAFSSEESLGIELEHQLARLEVLVADGALRASESARGSAAA